MAKLSRNQARKIKHNRLRYKINGTASVPRLNIFKSHQNLYAQLIDDTANNGVGAVLLSASTLKDAAYGGNIEAARKLGELFGEKIVAKKIEQVVFDRGGYLFHGRVKAFADAVRSKGVKF